MSSIPADTAEQSVLELRPSNRLFAFPLVVIAIGGLFAVPGVVNPKTHAAFVLGCIGTAFLGVLLALVLTTIVRTRGDDWRVRLDADGVTVRGHDPVPWSDLLEVRLTVTSSNSKSETRRIAFVPRPGVEVPTVPTAFPLSGTRSRERVLTERFGSTIVVSPPRMGVPQDRILDEVRRLSKVPIVFA